MTDTTQQLAPEPPPPPLPDNAGSIPGLEQSARYQPVQLAISRVKCGCLPTVLHGHFHVLLCLINFSSFSPNHQAISSLICYMQRKIYFLEINALQLRIQLSQNQYRAVSVDSSATLQPTELQSPVVELVKSKPLRNRKVLSKALSRAHYENLLFRGSISSCSRFRCR